VLTIQVQDTTAKKSDRMHSKFLHKLHKWPIGCGSVLGLPADLCSRHIEVMGSVQHLIIRTHRRYGSNSKMVDSHWLCCIYGVDIFVCILFGVIFTRSEHKCS